jgi:excisionase family DNA binding protein
MAADATQKLLTVREVGHRLGCSPWTVYRRIAAGEIPAVRLGSGSQAPLRVDADELERWLYDESEEAH